MTNGTPEPNCNTSSVVGPPNNYGCTTSIIGFQIPGSRWWSSGPVRLRCLCCFNNKHLQTFLYTPLSALQYSRTIPQKEKLKYAFTNEMMHFTPRTPVPCNCDCDEAPVLIRANWCLRQAQYPKIYKTRSHAGGK